MLMQARQMTMYTLHLTQGGLAKQARSPMVILVQSPTGHGQMIIKENVGEGARQRDEETTADNEGESELTKLSMPWGWKARKAPRKRGISKNATVVILSELRSRPCNQCENQNQPCMPRSKRGEHLEACKGCYAQKLS